MRMMLSILLFSFFLQIYGQGELDKPRVKKELDKIKYDLSTEIENEIEPFELKEKRKGVGISGIRYVIYIVAILALALVLFLVLRKFTFSQKPEEISSDVLLGEAIPESEILRRANLDKLISKEKEPKAVIRLLFLKVLQKLVRNDLLNTNPSKTNNQYIKDLLQFVSIDAFRQLVALYEEAWFSSNEASQADVETAEILKSEILKEI